MARVIPFHSEPSLQRLAEFKRETGWSDRRIRKISWKDIDFGRNVIWINFREFRVSARAMQILVDQLAERGTLW